MKDTRVTKLDSFLYKFNNKFNIFNEAPNVHVFLLFFHKLSYKTLLMPIDHEFILKKRLIA